MATRSAQKGINNLFAATFSFGKRYGDPKFASALLDVVAQRPDVLINKFFLFSNRTWRAFVQLSQRIKAGGTGLAQLLFSKLTISLKLCLTPLKPRFHADQWFAHVIPPAFALLVIRKVSV